MAEVDQLSQLDVNGALTLPRRGRILNTNYLDEGLCRASDLRCSHQTHGAITQVAILEQYENRQKQRQGRGQQR